LGGSLAVFRPARTPVIEKPGSRGELLETMVMILLKIVIHPLLVWLLAAQLFHIDPLWAAVAVMAAGMPVGINAYMFAQKYQECLRVVGTAVLVSTLLAVGTQTVMLAIFMGQ
jgi:predicted permease